MTPHLNCLVMTVQLRGSNVVSMRNKKNYPSVIIKYSRLSRALFITSMNSRGIFVWFKPQVECVNPWVNFSKHHWLIEVLLLSRFVKSSSTNTAMFAVKHDLKKMGSFCTAKILTFFFWQNWQYFCIQYF